MPKQRQFRAKPRVCVLCGAAPAETTEHIPPKGFLIDRSEGQLATVPSCKSCNQGTSLDDEEFILCLGYMTRGHEHGGFSADEEYWLTHVRPILKHRGHLLAKARCNTHIMDGKVALVDAEWLEPVFHKTMTKSVRGFHWRFFKEVLPPVTAIGFSFLEFDESLIPNVSRTHFVGKQLSVYAVRDEHHPHDVWWFFKLFSLWLAAGTGALSQMDQLVLQDSPQGRRML